jgi:hypothetical protein
MRVPVMTDDARVSVFSWLSLAAQRAAAESVAARMEAAASLIKFFIVNGIIYTKILRACDKGLFYRGFLLDVQLIIIIKRLYFK